MTLSQKLRIAQKISSMRFFLRVHNGNKCFESYDTWKVMISYDAMESHARFTRKTWKKYLPESVGLRVLHCSWLLLMRCFVVRSQQHKNGKETCEDIEVKSGWHVSESDFWIKTDRGKKTCWHDALLSNHNNIKTARKPNDIYWFLRIYSLDILPSCGTPYLLYFGLRGRFFTIHTYTYIYIYKLHTDKSFRNLVNQN